MFLMYTCMLSSDSTPHACSTEGLPKSSSLVFLKILCFYFLEFECEVCNIWSPSLWQVPDKLPRLHSHISPKPLNFQAASLNYVTVAVRITNISILPEKCLGKGGKGQFPDP